ncbi:MAG: hypothetical protein IPI30_09190 [Saprospiraceae bacterium]|nr:hypothetical protein [Candidatus Vicinibacter affinis]
MTTTKTLPSLYSVPGATSITLDFEFFATERTHDVMTIYEGPNKNGPRHFNAQWYSDSTTPHYGERRMRDHTF